MQVRTFLLVLDAHRNSYIQLKVFFVVIGFPAAVIADPGLVVFKLLYHEVNESFADAQAPCQLFGGAGGFVLDKFVEAMKAFLVTCLVPPIISIGIIKQEGQLFKFHYSFM